MKVFEDLVVELKEENLLEETVIDRSGKKKNGNGVNHNKPGAPDGFQASADFEFGTSSFEDDKGRNSAGSFQLKPSPETIKRRLSEMMSALQFVEYVLTAVEANFTGASNAPFDDLSTKKALHTFEQACTDPDSDDYFEAESVLMSRLESWETNLAERDRLIPVDAFRQFTETANPPLSPQTLFSLIRFYREIKFSETTGAKFDFLTTRLFSKFVDGEVRDLLCPRGEIVRHLNQRYSDWSGGQYKRTDSDDQNTALLVLSFDDFMTEAAGSSDLGEMLANKLFERIVEFKESVGEQFMIPDVSAAAVDCNISVANRVIDYFT